MKELEINRCLKVGQWHQNDVAHGRVSFFVRSLWGEAAARTQNAEETRTLFRYLASIVLPKVERVEDKSALHRGDIDWRVDGITYVTRDYRTGEVSSVSVTGPKEIANLLACLMAAEEAGAGQ